MQDYYDTGVLLKLYTNEPDSKRTASFVVRRARAIRITQLHLSEATTALQLKAYRGECSPEQAHAAISLIEDDLRSGMLRMAAIDWPDAWIRCQTLARTHAAKIGARTLDTLHVASALALHAHALITTDHRQADLARACGLKVMSPR